MPAAACWKIAKFKLSGLSSALSFLFTGLQL
jgi:hypothetical protein